MKRVILSLLLLTMLVLIVVPLPVFSNDPTAPDDYLSTEEKSYVTQVRSIGSDLNERLENAKGDLNTAFLQDEFISNFQG
jgi:hypothetical protein